MSLHKRSILSLHTAHLLEAEVAHARGRLVRQGLVPPRRADEAIENLEDLRTTRYPHFVLLPRMWQLRHDLSSYDAAHVALTETLSARLITCDRRLASRSGHTASIELF